MRVLGNTLILVMLPLQGFRFVQRLDVHGRGQNECLCVYEWKGHAILGTPGVGYRHEDTTHVYPVSSLEYLSLTSWQILNLKVNSG